MNPQIYVYDQVSRKMSDFKLPESFEASDLEHVSQKKTLGTIEVR